MSRTDSGVHPDVLWKYGSRPPKPRGGFPNEFANCVRFQTASKSHCRCGLESSKSCTSSKSCFAYSTRDVFFTGVEFQFWFRYCFSFISSTCLLSFSSFVVGFVPLSVSWKFWLGPGSTEWNSLNFQATFRWNLSEACLSCNTTFWLLIDCSHFCVTLE